MNINKNPTFLPLFCCICLLMMARCSSKSVAGGASGSEVSACTGTVVDGDGNPVENAVVRLRPVTFLADSGKSEWYKETHSIFNTVTGYNGSYEFSRLLPDSYSVEVVYNNIGNNDTLGSLAYLWIGHDETVREMYPITVVPLANISGNITIDYGGNASVVIQPYGLDRLVNSDQEGNFTLKVPLGAHRLHIAAYQKEDTVRSQELDGIDLSLSVVSGEYRDAGLISLRSPPPPPCKNGSCDITIVQSILNASGNTSVSLEDVITTNRKDRIVTLNLAGLDLSDVILDDIVRLSELRELNLGNTQITELFHNIDKMMNLHLLKLGGNHLSKISPSIGGLRNLTELDVKNNELTGLPGSITNCTNLSIIDISGNRICSVKPTFAQWLEMRCNDCWNSQRCP